jgi:hypothetical protein
VCAMCACAFIPRLFRTISIDIIQYGEINARFAPNAAAFPSLAVFGRLTLPSGSRHCPKHRSAFISMPTSEDRPSDR